MLNLELVREKSKKDERGTMFLKMYKVGAYDVNVTTTVSDEGGEWRNITVCKDREEKFLPQIFFDNGSIFDREDKFTIQTTSYGALSAEEIKEVIKGYEQAVEVVECLTAEFIK